MLKKIGVRSDNCTETWFVPTRIVAAQETAVALNCGRNHRFVDTIPPVAAFEKLEISIQIQNLEMTLYKN